MVLMEKSFAPAIGLGFFFGTASLTAMYCFRKASRQQNTMGNPAQIAPIFSTLPLLLATTAQEVLVVQLRHNLIT
jgi:hypothetical protein